MLCAAFAYAVMNYLDEWQIRRLSRDATPEGEEVDSIGILVITSGSFGLIVAFGFATTAMVTGQFDTLFTSGSKLIFQIMGVGAIEIIYLIPYYYATKRSSTLEAAPLFQSIPVISLVVGLLFFKEVPPAVHIAGGIAIVGGGFLLNLVPGTLKLDLRTIGLMLGASTLIAFEYFLFKDAVETDRFIAAGFWNGIGMALTGLTIFIVWPPYRRQFTAFAFPQNGKKRDRLSIALQLVNEVADAFSGLATQFASVIGPSVLVVSSLNAYQPVFILIIGAILAKGGSRAHAAQLKGGEFYKKFIAIALIALGTVLVAQT